MEEEEEEEEEEEDDTTCPSGKRFSGWSPPKRSLSMGELGNWKSMIAEEDEKFEENDLVFIGFPAEKKSGGLVLAGSRNLRNVVQNRPNEKNA